MKFHFDSETFRQKENKNQQQNKNTLNSKYTKCTYIARLITMMHSVAFSMSDVPLHIRFWHCDVHGKRLAYEPRF